MPARSNFLLVNPAAGGGRARRLRDRAVDALRSLGPLDVLESTGSGDEQRLAGIAAGERARALIVLGGDGAVSHAARGLIAAASSTPLAVIAAGTGNDFVKSLGTPSHDLSAMTPLIARGQARAIDAGLIDDVAFVNAAGFGFDVDVVRRIQASRGRSVLRGTAQYVVTALGQLFRYRGFPAGVTCAESPQHAIGHDPTRDSTPLWMLLVLANGAHFGGAFHIAPHAVLDDGVLELVGIRDIPPATRAQLFARATRGAHVPHPSVESARGTSFTFTFADAPWFQADGELHRARSTSVVVRCLPRALHVLV